MKIGEVFSEKSFAFHYTEISKSFWIPPYLQKKEPSWNLIHEGSLFGRHYNDNIFGFGTLRKLMEQFFDIKLYSNMNVLLIHMKTYQNL